MASGIARGRVRRTATDRVAQDDGHTPAKRSFVASLIDIEHLCYGQLTPVKTRYPLARIR